MTDSLRTRLRTRAAYDLEPARATPPPRLVLPEGQDDRVVQAAVLAARDRIATPILLGSAETADAAARRVGAPAPGLTWLDPLTDPRLPGLASALRERAPGVVADTDAALELLTDPLYFATMLVLTGEAAGMVAGASTSTAATIQPALQVRRLTPGLGPVNSCFLMDLSHLPAADVMSPYLVFADCALTPAPSPAMLAQIAITAARAADELCGLPPRVALLSSSTWGSAGHDAALRVRAALSEVKRRAPDLCVDGELQVDAALVPEVGQRKAAGSPVAGRANVLVFPDLESGNIAYKLVERIAGARATGPLFFGLNFPVNDLSRGCEVDDILDVMAVTAIQARASGSAVAG